MEKADIKAILEDWIKESRTIQDMHYIKGVIKGLLMADVITGQEANKFQSKLEKQITF